MRTLHFVVSLWLATSPLHSKIVFYSKRDGNSEIYKMDSDGNNQIRLTHHPEMDINPTWSPNGQQIVFHSLRHGGGTPEIYVMDADGGNLRRLTFHNAYDGSPHWHPNGQRIVFVSSRGGGGIYTMDTDGSNTELITEIDFGSKPRWSPDGEQIAFEGVLGEGSREIYIIDADGTNRWQVSKIVPRSSMRLGGWSPNGKKILYTVITAPLVQDDDFEFSMMVATLNRASRKVVELAPVRLPPGPLLDTQGHSWGVDGKSILISGKLDKGANRDIYRFLLFDHQLIQLTNTPDTDFVPHEWNVRLPVESQGILPQCWGRIKVVILSR